jgi:hypothetical protein
MAVAWGCSQADGRTDRNLAGHAGLSTLALVTAPARAPEAPPTSEIERITRRPDAAGLADLRRDAAALAKASPGADRGG